MHIQFNGTESLTFTDNPDMKHKTQEWPKSKIVRTVHNKRAYVTVMAVLIIFRLILQTVINLRMLFMGKQGDLPEWSNRSW